MQVMNDHGLSDFVGILEKYDVQYWVDSGVLLGLLRENHILSGEKDIDLAVLGTEIEKILGIKRVLTSKGYDMRVRTYLGTVFSINFNPVDDSSKLPVSIHVYYTVGDNLWSPQVQFYSPPPAPDIILRKRTRFGYLLKKMADKILYRKSWSTRSEKDYRYNLCKQSVAYKVSRMLYNRIDLGLLTELWPTRDVFCSLTWVIPKRLVFPLAVKDFSIGNFPVPGLTDIYLSYRYGNWRMPLKDWYYWRDDGAIVREKPGVVRSKLCL